MKFSYNWIRELVPELDVTPQELARLITMKTAESEGVEEACPWLSAVCEARIVSVEPIEGSRNVKAVVETARYGVRTVVCGAPNCRPGVLTAYIPAGTILQGREIRKAVIAGVESDGMLASGAELGLNREHEGILELAAGELEHCRPDGVIEIDNKSITHRPDLWGHHGMAREVAAITGKRLLDPVKLEKVPAGEAAVKVSIEDLELCPRYSALVFANVTVKPSPLWLQHRLEVIGLNPINNIVDVTNYVMAELAQPMHAFDADKLRGNTIFVRPAKAGEQVYALNGEMYEVGPSNLVIADAGGPVALAGVIGGMESAISDTTTRIVLESANFNAASIRKTSSALKLRTDASMRFEKSQDPVNTVRALARAVELLELVSPGIVLVGGVADSGRELAVPPPIELPLAWLYRKLGRELDTEEVIRILKSLEFGVSEVRPGVLSVTVPSWRATKDISIKDDLVEEVGRIIGYDSITPAPPMVPSVVPPRNEEREFHHQIREFMSAQGFTEVYNYSFVSEEMAAEFGFDADTHVRIANPIASDQTLLRTSLLPGIRKNILENSKHFDSFRLFEIGREIHKRESGLPEEVPHLVAALYSRGDGVGNLFELKRVAEGLMPGVEVRAEQARPFEHPARVAGLCWQGVELGRLFEFHPSMVETGRAAVLDVDLAALFANRPQQKRYRPLRRFPTSAFDLSVITGARERAGDIQKRMAQLAGEFLVSVEFLMKYAGAPLPEGYKSVSFRLTVGAPDRTLSSDDVAQIRARVIEGLRVSGYELRV